MHDVDYAYGKIS